MLGVSYNNSHTESDQEMIMLTPAEYLTLLKNQKTNVDDVEKQTAPTPVPVPPLFENKVQLEDEEAEEPASLKCCGIV